jgi:PAS domain S-box-containing protein
MLILEEFLRTVRNPMKIKQVARHDAFHTRINAKVRFLVPGILLCAFTGRAIRRFLILPAIATAFLLPWSTAEVPVKEVRRVLIFNTYGPLSSPGVALMDRTIVTGLEQAPYQIELYSENLETTLFPDEEIRREFLDWSTHKYRDRKPDVIIAVGREPLKLLVETHEETFPGVPIVFCGSTKEMLDQLKLDSSFTGVWGVAEPEKTLIAALHLQPSTKHVVVVGGMGAYDRELEAIVKRDLHSYESKLDFTYLTDLDMLTLLERLKHLPNDTIVYHTSLMQDAAGARFIDASQSVPMIASAANAPVFVVDDVDLGRGTVGGDLLSFDVEGQTAAVMAVRVLNGERPENISIVENASAYMFDWRALRRFGLKESDLPPGSIVLNRQPTLWESYKWYIIGGLSLIALEGALIIALMWQRARRRRTENELGLTYDRLRMAVEAARSVGWDADLKKGSNRWFGDLQTMFGIQSDSRDGRVQDFRTFVHPEDVGAYEAGIAEARNNRSPYAAEFRVVRKDGDLRWISAKGKFYFTPNGEPERMLGMATDITERKLAEEALNSLSGRLIQAQEEERSRIAREIHDDYQQRLAMLSIDVEELGKYLNPDSSEGSDRLRELWDRLGELGSDLHSLSHQLHSSTLDSLGLVAALRSLCAEFSEYNAINVNFVEANVPRNIPTEVALCLFRITQEALQNVKKHSRADAAEVRVEGLEQKIHLSISDRGTGFDQGAARQSGIGIQSMEERARLVGGQFALHSRPGEGTRIDVWVPIGS